MTKPYTLKATGNYLPGIAKRNFLFPLMFLLILMMLAGTASAQTMPVAQALPYSQNFAGFAGTTTVYPAGWQGWQVSAAAPSATGRTGIPASDKTIAGGTAASTGSGVYDYNGKIGFLSVASSDVALCLAVNTTGYSNIRVVFDAMTIRNLYTGTANYANGLVLQYRVGTGATLFTNLAYAPAEYITGTTVQTTGTTGIDVVTGLNAILPAACENQAVVQIRWIYRNAGGTSGSRPSCALDNISVQQVPVTFTSGWPKAENPTASGFTAKTNLNTPGTTYFVVLPTGATAPTSAQVKAGQDATGTSVAANEKGSIVSTAGVTEYSTAVTGLASNTAYDVYFVAEGNSGASLQSSPVLASVTTIGSAIAPTLVSPTATSITNNTAVLGGSITSDGGSSITDRGTVWNTSTGVTISDNPLSEGTFATGIFSHTRSLLPAKSQIFYAAYATNLIGTSLSPESSFFTMADEPTSHVGSFAVNTIPGNYTSLNLTWTPATGADGYLIIQRLGASAPGTAPSDITGYTVGNTLGTGTIAAVILSGAATSQLISGLTSTTLYTYRIYPFGYDGVNAQTYNYYTTPTWPTASGTTDTPPPTSYLWTGATDNNWTVATNWNPNRTTPYSNDIIQFNGGGSVAVVGVPAQSIGQLLISNSTEVSLQSSAAVTLTISGGTGVDLDVPSGSALNLGSTNATNAITLAMVTGATGAISGTMTFNGDIPTVGHKLTAVDASSITFLSGAIFTAGANFTGNAFGTTNNSSVVFSSGSTYVQAGGANPFGASAPGSAVVFQSGSLYKFIALTGGPSYSGRTYANFENDAPTIQNNQGSSPMTCDNYTCTSGTVNWDFTGGLVIKGNISVSSAATLTFGNATKVTNLTMGGTSAQTISGTGTMFFGANGTLTVNNAAGVSLLSQANLNNLAITTGTFKVASGASLITNGTVPSSVTVERSINAWGDADHGWHLLSSPITTQAIQPGFVSTPPDAGEDFYSWDETTNNWINSKDLSGAWNSAFEANFAVGKGYLVAYQNTSTRSFAGILNTSDVNVTGLTNSSGANHGWNLLGNPFASALKWNDGNWSLSNVTATAKIWDEAGAAYIDIASNDIIPALNGFMVESSGSGTLTIPLLSRTHSSQAWYKNGEGSIILTARDLDNSRAQQSVIRLNDQATEGFDAQFDSHFLGGYAPKFYSLQGEEILSTNTLPDLSDSRIVEMGFVKNAATSFSIELSAENQLPNLKVYLTDKKTGTVTDLSSTQGYSFTAGTGDDPNRFRLHFKDATSVSDPEAARNFTIFTENGFVNVKSNSMISAEVKIIDMAGRTLAKANLSAGETSRINMLGHTGVYVVSLTTANGVSNEKIIVK
jgi:hypothetical protein